jgi:hypothetical protein
MTISEAAISPLVGEMFRAIGSPAFYGTTVQKYKQLCEQPQPKNASVENPS